MMVWTWRLQISKHSSVHSTHSSEYHLRTIDLSKWSVKLRIRTHMTLNWNWNNSQLRAIWFHLLLYSVLLAINAIRIGACNMKIEDQNTKYKKKMIFTYFYFINLEIKSNKMVYVNREVYFLCKRIACVWSRSCGAQSVGTERDFLFAQ